MRPKEGWAVLFPFDVPQLRQGAKPLCNSLEFGGVFLRLPCQCVNYSQGCEMACPRVVVTLTLSNVLA